MEVTVGAVRKVLGARGMKSRDGAGRSPPGASGGGGAAIRAALELGAVPVFSHPLRPRPYHRGDLEPPSPAPPALTNGCT